LSCNATGTHKLEPLVIGKYQRPRCFKSINLSTLPVTYRANSKAWMRSDIFRDWVRKFDSWCQIKKINTLLLVDNASSHLDRSRLPNSDENSLSVQNRNTSNIVDTDDEESNQGISNYNPIQLSNQSGAEDQYSKSYKLKNVMLYYLPPNTTALLQPMDAGIIHSFKANYKKLFCRFDQTI